MDPIVVRFAAVCAMAPLLSCGYSAKYGCEISCAAGGTCPDGFMCNAGLCRSAGATTCGTGQSGDATTDTAPIGDAALGESDAPTLASCAGLANTCGATGAENCCESPAVTGGTYARSFDVSGDGMHPDSSFVATVSEFRLDKYEVTVGRFRRFVEAGQGTQANPPADGAGAHPNIATSGWDSSWNGSLAADTTTLIADLSCDAMYQTWTDTPGTSEERPINCVSWYEAMAFCAWDGGFLATETEWNYAAAGGSDQRAYPWSTPSGATIIDCTYANYSPSTACAAAGPNNVGAESPKGDGKWGQSDLAGNVWEWTLDSYASPYAQNPCSDCANLAPTTERVVRGARFSDVAPTLRTAVRGYDTPTYRNSDVGLRCARSP